MKKIIFLIIFLVVAHIFGMQDPYYSTFYYDDILHFMGGLTLAVMAFEFFPRFKLRVNITNIFVFIIVISLLWEIYEYTWDHFFVTGYGLPVMQLSHLDTVSDFCFALLGGLVYFLFKNIRRDKK